MIFEMDPYSQEPIYLQLRKQIILALANGNLQEGELLPPVRQLAQEMNVNPMTVSKAYAQLKEEGYLITDRRKGTAAHRPPTFTKEEEQDYHEQLALLLAQGYLHHKSKTQLLKEIEQHLNNYF